MTIQYSTDLRSAIAAVYETTIGASPKLELRTGAPPANCAASDTGTLLAEMTLPSDWMAAASGGAAAKTGTWSAAGVAAGSAAHYRLKSSGGTCHEQGTVTATGGGGDLTLDNVVIAVSQAISISGWTRTAAGE